MSTTNGFKAITEQQKRELLAQCFTEQGFENWRKVPSVMTGGKPHFFVRFGVCDGRRFKETIVWNRRLQGWRFERE